MTQPSSKSEKCHIAGSDKLPAEVGGPSTVCAAIKSAVGKKGVGADYKVEVRVLSASSLAAIVHLSDGRILPEQKMAVSDRLLNKGSIGRFADAIAFHGSSGNRTIR